MHSVLIPWLLGLGAASPGQEEARERFDPPVRLTSGGQPLRVEAPGYASPCWADVDGDGEAELLVGQFSGGKVKVYSHVDGANFGAGRWLQAGGKTAEIPGVW